MRICVSLENNAKDRYWFISGLGYCCLDVSAQFLEHRVRSAICIHNHPLDLLQRLNHLLELFPHLPLKRTDLVPLPSESTSLLLLLRIEIEAMHQSMSYPFAAVNATPLAK